MGISLLLFKYIFENRTFSLLMAYRNDGIEMLEKFTYIDQLYHKESQIESLGCSEVSCGPTTIAGFTSANMNPVVIDQTRRLWQNLNPQFTTAYGMDQKKFAIFAKHFSSPEKSRHLSLSKKARFKPDLIVREIAEWNLVMQKKLRALFIGGLCSFIMSMQLAKVSSLHILSPVNKVTAALFVVTAVASAAFLLLASFRLLQFYDLQKNNRTIGLGQKIFE